VLAATQRSGRRKRIGDANMLRSITVFRHPLPPNET
jgi:hypothetical protein